jgi:hypothetical protein
MERPLAGIHYPKSLGELRAWFPTDADCLDYLEWVEMASRLRLPVLWPFGRMAAWRRQVQVHWMRQPYVQ